MNPIKAITIPRCINQIKSFFGPNTCTKTVPINVCSENPARINPDEEIDKLFKFTYPDYEFVKFKVVEMTLVRPPSNREIFCKLFLPEE